MNKVKLFKGILKNKWLLLLVPVVGFFFILVPIIAVIYAPIMAVDEALEAIEEGAESVGEWFSSLGNWISGNGWCKDAATCAENAEKKYYEEVVNVVTDYKEDGIEIEQELINAAIFYGYDYDKDLNSALTEEEAEEATDTYNENTNWVSKLAKNMVSGNSLDLNKFRNYLINTFIPDYKSDYIEGSTDAEKKKSITKIADYIMLFSDKWEGLGNKDCAYNATSSETVNINLDYLNQLKIKVLHPSWKEYDVSNATNVDYTVSLKEYVMGVVYREIGASMSTPVEALKANMIAIKSYTIGRRNAIKDSDGTYYIKMRNNTNDQVYCNIKDGCLDATKYKNNLKPAPSQELVDYMSQTYDEVINDYLYNVGSKKFVGSYRDKESTCISDKIGGSCLGQEESTEMASSGKDYRSILASFYTNGTGIIDISTNTVTTGAYNCAGSGTVAGATYSSNVPDHGTTTSTFLASRNTDFHPNNYGKNIVGFQIQNYGQCVWFAKGRALEFIYYSNIPDDQKQKMLNNIGKLYGNGADWYKNPSSNLFKKSSDLYQPQVGAIVSWSGGRYDWCPSGCGHVAIVEEVKLDSSGNLSEVCISEGWTSGSAANYTKRCLSMEKLEKYSTNKTYKFNGYVYLLG